MKKLIVVLTTVLFLLPAISFAAKDSNVYIGGTLFQSFSRFHYQTFSHGFLDDTGDSVKFLSGPRFDLFVGYILGKVRVEGQYTMISSSSFNDAIDNSSVKYKASGIYANLIYDFWDVRKTVLTPFIGLGVGIASPDLILNVNSLQDEQKKNGVSYQLQAGLNLRLTDWLLINIKYSFLAMPAIRHSFKDVSGDFKNGVQSAGAGVILLL